MLIFLSRMISVVFLRMSQIQNIFTILFNKLRRPSLIQNIVFCLTITSFSEHAVYFWFPFLQNEKVIIMTLETKLVSETKLISVIIQLQSQGKFFALWNANGLHFKNVDNRKNGNSTIRKGTRTYNHLVRKWTLHHLAKLANWLNCVVVLMCTVHLTVCYYHVTYAFPEWIHTL